MRERARQGMPDAPGPAQPAGSAGISERARLFVLLAIIGVYLTLCLVYLPRPGLEYDEVLYGDAALGTRAGSFITYEWHIGALRFPVMLMTYIGAVRAWLYAPIFAVFGVSPWTIRLPMIALGAVTLFSVERVTRAMFGARTALLAAVLLAVDPSFLFGTREDYGFISIMLATKTASLALMVEFARRKRAAHLFGSSFLLGVGLFDKFNFAWHIGAVGVASVLVWPWIRPFISKRNIGLATIGLVAGCWPLLVYNIASHGGTLSGVEPEPSLHDAIATKLAAIRATVEGIAFPTHALGAAPGDASFLPWALLLSVPAAALGRRHIPLRWLGFCLVAVIATIGAIIVTPKATGGHHAMMLWPFLHVLVAAATVGFTETALEWPGGVGAFAMLGPVAAMALLLSSLSLDLRTLAAYEKSGGRGIWSDAIYDLADAVGKDRAHRYLFMDWGMSNQVLLLSSGKSNQEETFWAVSEPGKDAAQVGYLHDRISDPRNLLVFTAPGHEIFPQPRHVFELMLEQYRLKEEVLKTFHEKDGAEAYRIVRISDGDTGDAVPRTTRLIANAAGGSLQAERTSRGCVDGNGVFAIKWSAPGAAQTEIHVASPDGPLFSRSGSSGEETTGQWVTPGTVFYLQDTSPGGPQGPGTTIARLVIDFTCP